MQVEHLERRQEDVSGQLPCESVPDHVLDELLFFVVTGRHGEGGFELDGTHVVGGEDDGLAALLREQFVYELLGGVSVVEGEEDGGLEPPP